MKEPQILRPRARCGEMVFADELLETDGGRVCPACGKDV